MSVLDKRMDLEDMLDLPQSITLSPINSTIGDGNCSYETMPYLDHKFFLITICGSGIAGLGILNNCLLLYLLAGKLPYKQTYIFYLVFLAFFDACVELSYILIFSLGIVYDYAGLYDLYRVWHTYVRIIFVASQISTTASTYLLVAASFERYLTTAHWTRRCFTLGERLWAVGAVVIFSFLSKGTVFWEVRLVLYPQCSTFGSIQLETSELARNAWYYTVWMFWFRNIFHVFVPFFLLLFLNSATLWKLRRNLAMRSAVLSMALGQEQAKERKESIKSATRMLATIVSIYLLTNTLHIVLTTWEHINIQSLKGQFLLFYTFAADTVSLLTVFSGAIRLPIYYTCNARLRREVKTLVLRILHLRKREPVSGNSSSWRLGMRRVLLD